MRSPETLIFILHLSVILCSGILVISFVNSLLDLRMTLRRHGAVLAAAVGASAVSMAAYGVSAPGDVDPATAGVSASERIVVAEVAPFGMASRKPVPVAPAPTVEPATAAGGVADMSLYNVHCIACHGPDAAGVEGLGVDLVASEYVAGASSEELITFLQQGRMPDAADTVTGRPMPAFAWMEEGDLANLADFLQQTAAGGGN